MKQPTLQTERLLLRPFVDADAGVVQRLAGDIRIARGTAAVPHPYPDGAAESWIGGHAASFDARREITFALVERESGDVVSAASLLNISSEHARAELGFWVGVDYWSRGYCTEAAGALIQFASTSLGTSKIVGRCLAWNVASASVFKKLGFLQEGRLAKHVLREGQYVDQLLFGLVLEHRGMGT